IDSFENVYYHGLVPRKDILKKMCESKVFVGPSRNEAFGQVYLEALMSGCNVIGSENTGAAEILKDVRNGYLVQKENLEDLKMLLIKSSDGYDLASNIAEWKKVESKYSRECWCLDMSRLILSL
ncbi:glycosyltransferase, partial [Schleiferiaceae bacterium]|nr:glycosyltransferase [Schleiferiaceae bacterium]